MGPISSLGDLFDMVRRRFVLIFLVTAIGSGLSVLFAMEQPRVYWAAEVLQVVQPKIADDLAKTTVEGSSARRLQLIEQQLMARSSLQEMIEQFGIYADQPGLKPDTKVAMLRSAVQITGLAAAREGFSDDGTISVLTISAEMPTAELAQQVAHEFAQRTIEISNETRIGNARETLDFFLAREQILSDEIAKLEDEVVRFRDENEISLPGSIEFRREEIATINEGLLTIARERIEFEREMERSERTDRPATVARKRADFIEQIATLDAQRDLLLERKRELEASIETTPYIERRLNAYERQLDQLRDEFELISARRAEAEVGYRLESQNQAERLTVIEEATVPEFPISRSRKMIAAAGGVASLLVGIVLAFLLDLRKPVIRTAAQMERQTGLKPVVSIPTLNTRRRRTSGPEAPS
ncbi:GumC family protein [Primorskyibacter sp. S87]|uniref:GumC family protein n=1 Tax=Primorskyibacter sp. S87 TaxID=3415126 RepID=UPI003C7A57BE